MLSARDAEEREKWLQGLENAILRHTHGFKVSTALYLEFNYLYRINNDNNMIFVTSKSCKTTIYLAYRAKVLCETYIWTKNNETL